MAGSLLKRANAVVWLPPRSAGGSLTGDTRVVAFARNRGEWAGATVSIAALANRKRVILLADARDCTLLQVPLPPMSTARMLQALPNAVEDLLLQDVATCALAVGPVAASVPGAKASAAQRRLVVAADRAWLEQALTTFEKREMQVLAIWPAQLTLPVIDGTVSIACVNDGLTVRTGVLEGFGWPAGERDDARAAALRDVIGVIDTGEARALSITAVDASWRGPIGEVTESLGRPVRLQRLDSPRDAPVDLLPPVRTKLRSTRLAAFDWRDYRWPLGLVAASVLVALLGLNVQWWLMSREQGQLVRGMQAAFRQQFPQVTSVADPLLQARRLVGELRVRDGVSGSDDFVPLVQRLGQALGPRANDALASIDYRDGALKVRFRPGLADGDAAREQIRQAGVQQGLSILFEQGRDAVATVKVRS